MTDEQCFEWIMRRKEKDEEGFRFRSMRGKKIMRHFIEEEGYNRMDHVYHTYTYSCP